MSRVGVNPLPEKGPSPVAPEDFSEPQKPSFSQKFEKFSAQISPKMYFYGETSFLENSPSPLSYPLSPPFKKSWENILPPLKENPWPPLFIDIF